MRIDPAFPTGRARLLAFAAAFAVVVCGWLAAQANAFVYWTNSDNSAIARANLDGTGANQSFITGGNNPAGLAVDGQYVYWTNTFSSSIGRANLDGTGVDQSFISDAIGAWGLSVDGHYVYWSNYAGGTIGRANLDGTGINQSFISGANIPVGVAVDGEHVYWADSASGTIGRANLDGTGVNQSFITGASEPEAVAVDGQHVYWANSVSGTIGRANLDGTGVNQSFITGANFPEGVVIDGQYVYWTNNLGNTIGRANLDGTGVDQTFITGPHPWALAVDALVPPPTASITTPASGATYTQGQIVDSSFSCNDGMGGPGIGSCLDQNGQPSGTAIDTSTTGSHAMTVTATSEDGATGTASVTYTVTAAPSTPATAPATSPTSTTPAATPASTVPSPPPPVVGDLRQSHPRWREPGGSAQISNHKRRPPVGTVFSFTLNQPATVKLLFIQATPGRVIKINGKSRCVALTKRNRPTRNCARTVTVASLSLNGRRGADKIVFDGRVSPTHTLRPGRYTVTLIAINAGGESSERQSLWFTIVR